MNKVYAGGGFPNGGFGHLNMHKDLRPGEGLQLGRAAMPNRENLWSGHLPKKLNCAV